MGAPPTALQLTNITDNSPPIACPSHGPRSKMLANHYFWVGGVEGGVRKLNLSSLRVFLLKVGS
jgi:hypothetical protein